MRMAARKDAKTEGRDGGKGTVPAWEARYSRETDDIGYHGYHVQRRIVLRPRWPSEVGRVKENTIFALSRQLLCKRTAILT